MEATMAVSTPNKYPIHLSPEQRNRLQQIVSCGSASARKVQHAQVLLGSDHNRPGGHLTRDSVADALNMHVNTVDRIRKRFVLEGELPALNRKPRLTPPITPKLDARAEAHLVAICCSTPPKGRNRWTLRLLASEMKRRGFVTYICPETIRKTLKKMNCDPGSTKAGASPSATQRDSSRRWKKSSTPTQKRTPRSIR